MQPLISVIIPVNNVLPYLREALDSVAGQTYQNLEIIIVDDGSTDGSGDACDEYLPDSRVRVIHQGNRGLAGARNTGLDAASGEYVTFLDADDAWCPEMLQSMISGIDKNHADIASCGYKSCHTEGKLLPLVGDAPDYFFKDEVISGKDALRRLFLGGMNYAVWNKMYKRDLWDGLRFIEGRVYEDVPVMYQLFRKCEKAQLLPEILIGYRIHTGSITRTFSSKYVEDFLFFGKLIDVQVAECVPDLFSEKEADKIMENQLMNYIRQYCDWFESCRTEGSKKALSSMRAEILQRREKIRKNRLCKKAKIMYNLFLLSPHLYTKVSSIYRACQHSAGSSH